MKWRSESRKIERPGDFHELDGYLIGWIRSDEERRRGKAVSIVVHFVLANVPCEPQRSYSR